MSAAVAVLLIIGLVVSRCSSSHAKTSYVSAPAKYADIQALVNETGTVNPVNEVNVGTQVSGTIEALSVDYNSKVRKDQILAVIDPTLFAAALQQASANYEAAQATAGAALSSTQQAAANIATARANLDKAVAQANLSHLTVQRDHNLLSQGFIAQSLVDADVNTATANDTGVEAAKQQLAAAVAQYQGSTRQAAAAQAQAQAQHGQVQSANYNLTRAVIRSPIDGIVVSRNVSVGQTVAASFQTPTLFIIASTLKNMQIDASVDEADVGQLRVGQTAQVSVPAFPNVNFRGTVQQIRVNPIVSNNVVTYDAIISLHDESARLMPGMTATIAIDVAASHHVLTVPAAALLYRPDSSAASVANAVAGAPGSKVTIWVLHQGKAQPVNVIIGYSDSQNVQITSGDIHEGDKVVVASTGANKAPARPSMFGGRGGG
jgi:HlyD family secretion protein